MTWLTLTQIDQKPQLNFCHSTQNKIIKFNTFIVIIVLH